MIGRVVVGAAAIALVSGAICAGNSKAALLVGGSCPGATRAFAPWGDSHYYIFGANGGLELGASGWSLSGGSSVVGGNETYYLHARSDSHSLSIPAGAFAMSPPTCMETSSTVFRFFARGTGTLTVQAVERNLLGVVVGILNVSTVKAGTTWQPSPALLNLNSLQGLLGVSSVQFRFSSSGGNDQVDDLYVDPMASSN